MSIENLGQTLVEVACDDDGYVVAACLASHVEFGTFAKKFIAEGCAIQTITLDELMILCGNKELA